MALLTAQQITITGLNPTYTAVNATDTINFSSDRQFLHVKNGGGSSTTVTVVVPGTERGQAIPDVAVTVAAGGAQLIGPFDSGEAVLNVISVTYSPTTSVTAALLSI